MKTYIRNGILLTPDNRVANAVLTINDGVIEEIVSEQSFMDDGAMVIDAQGMYVAPGFIDLHFHGAMGMDVMDAGVESLSIMSAYCASHGVTTFYPTTWSAAPEDIKTVIENTRQNAGLVSGTRIAGLHLEGPYINPQYCGAQLPENIRKPDRREYLPWLESGVVKIVTCAPEVEGCGEFIRDALKYGVRVAIGHSNASYEQVKDAADAGVSQATHLFNAMGGLHHRDPGTAGGVLDDDRLLAQLICDGVHIHPAVVRLILKTKTYSRIALITDSIRGAGLADGDYEHNGQHIMVREGVARDPAGNLSGSTLAMDQALRNMIAFTGCSLENALSMVTSVPAEEMGLAGKGHIAAGYDADLVLFDESIEH